MAAVNLRNTRAGTAGPPSFASEDVQEVLFAGTQTMSEVLDRVAGLLFQIGAVGSVHDARIELLNRRTFVREIIDDHLCLLFLETRRITRSLVVHAKVQLPPAGSGLLPGDCLLVLVNPLWAFRDYSALRASVERLFDAERGVFKAKAAEWRTRITAFLDERVRQETPTRIRREEDSPHEATSTTHERKTG